MLCVTFLFVAPVSSSEVKQKPYVIGELYGQAGNNFFQIAATCALAWDNNAEPYFPGLSIIPSLYHHFFSRCKVYPPSKEVSFVGGGGPPHQAYAPIPFHPSMKVDGYLQSEKYFVHHRERIVNLFAPCLQDMQYIRKKYKAILSNPQTVGVQIRHYFEDPSGSYFPQYGKAYLEKAMSQFPPSSLFVVSSNNVEFAKKNIPEWAKNVLFLEGEPNYIDFYVLTMCKHNIITNSSFGWWSAWLNQNSNKIVVCPKVMFNGLNYQDSICPESWVRVDAKRGRYSDPTSY
jgi:hypothetical protein